MATLQTRLSDLITAIGTDWKNIWAKIGSGSLTTTSQNLIGAINEVKAGSVSPPDASETVKGIVELATTGESTTGTDAVRAVTPAGVKAVVDARVIAATTTASGITELATDAEALAMTDTGRTLTPSNLAGIVNVNNGLVKLDGTGKVGASQLPAYVDDVVEHANFAALPGTGATGIIYVTLDTNKTYRWSGSAYTEISASPGTTDALTEGTTNLYFTNARADTRADGRITALAGNTDTDLVALYTTAKV
jgi:hypothetical protein